MLPLLPSIENTPPSLPEAIEYVSASPSGSVADTVPATVLVAVSSETEKA